MRFEVRPEESAFFIIDMQNDLVMREGSLAKLGIPLWRMVKKLAVVENINNILGVIRRLAIPVFHVRTVYREDFRDLVGTVSDMSLEIRSHDTGKSMIDHMREFKVLADGSWGSEFVKELKPRREDYVITKRRGSAFYNTDLELSLNCIDVHTLIVTGVATEACVDSAVRGSIDRDFNVIVLTDCVATGDEEIQRFWIEKVFPRMAVTMTSEELLAALEIPD